MIAPILEVDVIRRYRELVAEMMEPSAEYLFRDAWIRQQHWVVAAAESDMRFDEFDLLRIKATIESPELVELVAVITEAGCLDPGVTAKTAVIDGVSTCWRLSADLDGLRGFNEQLGLFRAVVTSTRREWAISCNESYNLFAGSRERVEAFTGQTLSESRDAFRQFAHMVRSPELIKVAARYESL